jgi:DNA (cytosine-5)-methyltransferase 1
MAVYYNEFDSFAAAWLRELIKQGLIADGEVDERSIVDVEPADVRGFRQYHWFAGIGGWSYALRLAGWPDDRPVWTGSCPCQPLSSAGKRKGHADERHLWPAFHSLIAECRPATVFGEQVASKDGREWFSAVRADLEADGYACGGADLCAAGIGAPHIRQRLWWVAQRLAHANGTVAELAAGPGTRPYQAHGAGPHGESDGRGDAGRLVGAHGSGAGAQPGGHREACEEADRGARPDDSAAICDGAGAVGGMGHPERISAGRNAGAGVEAQGMAELRPERDDARPPSAIGWPGPTNGFWANADWLHCRDGKWRPVEPSTFPLAHGFPNRVGLLRGAGNAIVPHLAAVFIEACDGLIDRP